MPIEDVKCPECEGPMVSRKNSKTGEIFWGCKDYPNCTGTRDNMGEAPRRYTDFEAGIPSDRLRQNDKNRFRRE